MVLLNEQNKIVGFATRSLQENLRLEYFNLSIFIHKEYRGNDQAKYLLAQSISDHIISDDRPIYMSIKSDNSRMLRSANKLGDVLSGIGIIQQEVDYPPFPADQTTVFTYYGVDSFQ